MRRIAFLLLLSAAACGHEDRGWRGSMAGDWRDVAVCAAARLPAAPTLREDQRVAILAAAPRPDAGYEARLQETAPNRFFAEVREGAGAGQGLAAWRAIEACAEAGPDHVHPPGQVRAGL